MTAPTDTESVLQSIKKVLQIPSEYTAFDIDVTMHINSVLSTLYQLGFGATDDQFVITDGNDTWANLFTGYKAVNMIQTYIGMRVKQIFDPFQTGFATTSYDAQIKELEWRINVAISSSPNIPTSSTPPTVPATIPESEIIWDLTGGKDFPQDAPYGARGIDLSNGSTWVKTE